MQWGITKQVVHNFFDMIDRGIPASSIYEHYEISNKTAYRWFHEGRDETIRRLFSKCITCDCEPETATTRKFCSDRCAMIFSRNNKYAKRCEERAKKKEEHDKKKEKEKRHLVENQKKIEELGGVGKFKKHLITEKYNKKLKECFNN